MKTIISIGSVIKTLLSNYKELNKKVNGVIVPMVAPDKTNFPFITYSRTSNVESNKDTYQDNATVEVLVVSDRYDESVEIAELVRKVLDNYEGKINGFNIHEIKLISTNEYYSEPAYIQSLIFNLTINL